MLSMRITNDVSIKRDQTRFLAVDSGDSCVLVSDRQLTTVASFKTMKSYSDHIITATD